MTECREKCGSCCDPVTLPYSQAEASRQVTDPQDADTRHWILNDLTPMSPKEAKAREPFLFAKTLVPAVGMSVYPNFYSCKWFDREARACTNYEGRPKACSVWPWKFDAPNPRLGLPPTCSFRADVGKEVAPLPLRRKDGTIVVG